MHNLVAHKLQGIRQTIGVAGMTVCYLETTDAMPKHANAHWRARQTQAPACCHGSAALVVGRSNHGMFRLNRPLVLRSDLSAVRFRVRKLRTLCRAREQQAGAGLLSNEIEFCRGNCNGGIVFYPPAPGDICHPKTIPTLCAPGARRWLRAAPRPLDMC
jgi:hypothetical protein